MNEAIQKQTIVRNFSESSNIFEFQQSTGYQMEDSQRPSANFIGQFLIKQQEEDEKKEEIISPH